MKVFVYKDNFCDPGKNIGTCRGFGSSVDVDAYVKFWAVSINPAHISRYRIFVTNDDIDFASLDHYVLFNEYLQSSENGKIEEINILALARDCNEKVIAIEKRRSAARLAAEKQKKERPPQEPFPKSLS